MAFKGIAFGCDQCGSEFDTGTYDRKIAFSTLKREGWQFFYLDKTHNYHFCSERCIESWLNAKRK